MYKRASECIFEIFDIDFQSVKSRMLKGKNKLFCSSSDHVSYPKNHNVQRNCKDFHVDCHYRKSIHVLIWLYVKEPDQD
jgi:hypothetical protein